MLINNYKKTGLTLMELLIAISLIAVSILALTAVSVYVFRQVSENIERANIHKQIDYALDHIRLYLRSALSINYSNNSIAFEGESDPYNVTPDDKGDNKTYLYTAEASGNTTQGTLRFEDSNRTLIENLVDAKYNPRLIVGWNQGDPPNLLNVKITACLSRCRTNGGGCNENCNGTIIKEEAVRLWYIDVK